MRAGDLQAFWDVVLSGVVGREVSQSDETSGDEPGRVDKALGKVKSLFKRDD